MNQNELRLSKVRAILDRNDFSYREISSGILSICPFAKFTGGHSSQEDIHPSFWVSLKNHKFVFKCFACGISGDYEWLCKLFSKYYGADVDSLKTGNYHTEKKDISKKKLKEKVKEQLTEGLVKFYGMSTPMYYLKRGFDKQDKDRWEVGYDKQHMRLFFPVRNNRKILVGGVGRILVDDLLESKYYNYFNFPKEDYIYGECFWKPNRPTVLVEGILDTQRLERAIGRTHNVGGLMGTSFSSERRKRILLRYSEKVFSMLDNDDAGRNGTSKLIKTLKDDIFVMPITYYKKDPGECSVEELQRIFYG